MFRKCDSLVECGVRPIGIWWDLACSDSREAPLTRDRRKESQCHMERETVDTKSILHDISVLTDIFV